MTKNKETVVVGISGGVDSSVAAYLLKQQGYEVVGLFMQNWQSEPGEVCTSEIDFEDASQVCDLLDIKLHRANFSDDYWDRVFNDFLDEHKKGRTPNPDILCNREIKFKSFLDYAKKIGADFMATGHYADLVFKKEKTYLRRSIDLNKDQTYFLHEVSSNEFKYCLFPLANLTKPEVREIAKSIQLPNRNKKDSVGICFVGERNMKDFLNRFIDFEPGPIIDDSNNIIGEHHGSLLYTIGQRQGLRIGGVKDMPDLPWYVFKKDQKNNSLYVCQGEDNPLLFSKGLTLERLHWITDEFSGQLECEVQVRHRHKAVKCILDVNELEVRFDKEIRAITPGQSAVFYLDNICLGGGIIADQIN